MDPSHNTISLNTTYIILFKKPRHMSQLTHLGKQVYPGWQWDPDSLLSGCCGPCAPTAKWQLTSARWCPRIFACATHRSPMRISLRQLPTRPPPDNEQIRWASSRQCRLYSPEYAFHCSSSGSSTAPYPIQLWPPPPLLPPPPPQRGWGPVSLLLAICNGGHAASQYHGRTAGGAKKWRHAGLMAWSHATFTGTWTPYAPWPRRRPKGSGKCSPALTRTCFRCLGSVLQTSWMASVSWTSMWKSLKAFRHRTVSQLGKKALLIKVPPSIMGSVGSLVSGLILPSVALLSVAWWWQQWRWPLPSRSEPWLDRTCCETYWPALVHPHLPLPCQRGWCWGLVTDCVSPILLLPPWLPTEVPPTGSPIQGDLEAVWDTSPRTYVVAAGVCGPIKGTSYRPELQKVMPPDYFDVEAILDTWPCGNKWKYLVKWVGYLASFNSCESYMVCISSDVIITPERSRCRAGMAQL